MENLWRWRYGVTTMRGLHKWDYFKTFCCLLAVISVANCRRGRRAKRNNGKCSSDSFVEYNLSFFGDWSKEAFPRMYPKYRPHAQWSKLYGMSHGPRYHLWSLGQLASPAIKKFVEERNTLLLDKMAQGYNDTYDVFTAAPIRGGLGRTSVNIFADGTHSKVSFLVKIIPSPDWFVGVDGLDLCRHGRWRRKIYAHLRPKDAGTDKGFTYTSPNWPSYPQEAIFDITPRFPDHPASSFYYPDKTKLPRIAHAIIERVAEYRQIGRAKELKYNSLPNVEVVRQAHELVPKRMAGVFGSEEEPIDPKIDEKLVERLENDIQNKLKVGPPRKTMFLQRMMPLADQSSEEQDEVPQAARVKDASAQRKPFSSFQIVQESTTLPKTFSSRVETSTSRMNVADVRDPQEEGLETMKQRASESDVFDAQPQAEPVVRHSFVRSEGEDDGRKDENEETETDMVQKAGVAHQDSETGRVYEDRMAAADTRRESYQDQLPDVSSHSAGKELGTTPVSAVIRNQRENYEHYNYQERVDDSQEREVTLAVSTTPAARDVDHGDSDVIENNMENGADDGAADARGADDRGTDDRGTDDRNADDRYGRDYAAAYSLAGVKTVAATQGYQDVRHLWSQKESRSGDEVNQPNPSVASYGGEVDNVDNDDDVDDVDDDNNEDDVDDDIDDTPWRDNVDGEIDQRANMESLGVFQESATQKQANLNDQLDCLVSEWSEWSPCSKTCGFGVRTRSRDVIQHSQNGGEICPRLSVDVLCGSMRTCRWNYFNSLFNQRPSRRRRRRRRHHHNQGRGHLRVN